MQGGRVVFGYEKTIVGGSGRVGCVGSDRSKVLYMYLQ